MILYVGAYGYQKCQKLHLEHVEFGPQYCIELPIVCCQVLSTSDLQHLPVAASATQITLP